MNLQIALKLQQLRKEHGFSQEQLADELGVSRQAVSKWERAESSPDTDNLVCLARLYGVSLDELLELTPSATLDQSKTQPQEDVILPANAQVPAEDDGDDEDSDTPNGGFARALYCAVPLLCTVVYFVLGGVWNLWHPGWIVFVAIPVFETLISAIVQRRFCTFAYPIFCAVVYLLLGFCCQLWHPSWIVFVTIPLYYTVFGAIDKKIQSKN